jgi:hypothetical protein
MYQEPWRTTLERREELWGRRSVAVGALLVGLALIGGVALLIAGAWSSLS